MPRVSPLLSALFLVFLLADPAPADWYVTALGADDEARGLSLGLESGTLTLQGSEGPARTFAADEVVTVEARPGPEIPPVPARAFEVTLTDGSVLRGAPLSIAGSQLGLRSPVLREADGPLALPVEALYRLRRLEGIEAEVAARMLRIPGEDASYRLDGGRVTGFVESFLPTGVSIDRGSGSSREIAWDDLAALYVDNERRPAPDALHLEARLSDGSRVVLGSGARIAGGLLTGTTPAGIPVRVSIDDVVTLGFLGGRFRHLSDVEPAAIEREPVFPLPDGPNREALLDFVCPVRIDRSPDNRPIRIDNVRYEKGLGVRPRTVLRYDLGGAYREFTAHCGIDDEVLGDDYGHGGGTGSVVFEVRVDGEARWRSPVVRGGEAPRTVRVDLTRARILELVVDLVPADVAAGGGADTPELDNAVWARPLLVR